MCARISVTTSHTIFVDLHRCGNRRRSLHCSLSFGTINLHKTFSFIIT
jgi:hypothetical protein